MTSRLLHTLTKRICLFNQRSAIFRLRILFVFLPNNVKGKFSKLLTDVINLLELFANNYIIAVFLNFILHHSFIHYFSHLFNKDFATSTINVRRSSLSMTLEPIDGKKIGDHPLLEQLLKGCYNLKPPNPRYDYMWNPDMVFHHFSSHGPNSDLTLAVLSKKLVMLLSSLSCLGFLRFVPYL